MTHAIITHSRTHPSSDLIAVSILDRRRTTGRPLRRHKTLAYVPRVASLVSVVVVAMLLQVRGQLVLESGRPKLRFRLDANNVE